jgi:hypothetical protein
MNLHSDGAGNSLQNFSFEEETDNERNSARLARISHFVETEHPYFPVTEKGEIPFNYFRIGSVSSAKFLTSSDRRCIYKIPSKF